MLRGGANRDSLIGNEGANQLLCGAGADSGNGLNNVLVQFSGFGTLQDGGGHDTCFDDRSADQGVESLNGGADIVCSFANFVMGANVENLTAFALGSVDYVGNILNNMIIGANGNDTR